MHGQARIGWIDHARGICIILVVLMHSTLGVGVAMGGEGWLHDFVAFAEPFRVPGFFVIAGLFAHRVMGWQWRRFIDRRVFYYAYFYVLWVTVQFAFKAPGMAGELGAAGTLQAYLMAFVQPFGTLWFIYMLPVFFLLVRLTERLPAGAVLGIAVIAHVLPVSTGWLVIDQLAGFFVSFLAGHLLRERIIDFASGIAANPLPALLLLFLWAPVHAMALQNPSVPGSGLLLAALGTAAIVTVAVGAALIRPRVGAVEGLAWIGRHSIVIYLAFFLPMAVTRTLIVKTGLVTDIGLASLITTAAALTGPIVLFHATRITGLGRFLFERPRIVIYERRARDRVPVPAE